MAETKSVCAQFVPDLRREAKGIFWARGRWVSGALGLSFRKVAVQDGFPFLLKASGVTENHEAFGQFRHHG